MGGWLMIYMCSTNCPVWPFTLTVIWSDEAARANLRWQLMDNSWQYNNVVGCDAVTTNAESQAELLPRDTNGYSSWGRMTTHDQQSATSSDSVTVIVNIAQLGSFLIHSTIARWVVDMGRWQWFICVTQIVFSIGIHTDSDMPWQSNKKSFTFKFARVGDLRWHDWQQQLVMEPSWTKFNFMQMMQWCDVVTAKAERNECLKIRMDTAVEQEHLQSSAIQSLSFENVWSHF